MKKGQQLVVFKKNEKENTQLELEKALKRFESGNLEVLPKGSKLSRKNLALEASVSHDTPYSRYRRGKNNGEYRYPEIVKKFIKLREKLNQKANTKTLKNEIIGMKRYIKDLEELLLTSREIVNLQDIEISNLTGLNVEIKEILSEKETKIAELEKELSGYKKNNIRLISNKKK